MLTGIKDVNTSASSVSSTESTGNPGFETSKTSTRKRKYFTLPRNKSDKKKGQNKISKNDFYSKTIEFRLWLAEEKKIDFDTVTEKKLREYFKKFVKKWNNKKLAMKYYVGVDPLWAVSSPGAYSRTYTRTPEYSQDASERCDTDSLFETSSVFGTFGKDTGCKISKMIQPNTSPNSSNTEGFTWIRTRSATRLDTSTPRHLRELFDPPGPQRAISSVLSPKKRHASMEELSSPCKIKDSGTSVGLKRTRSRSALCGRYDTTTTPAAAQSMHNLTNWRYSYAEPDQEEHIATILRRPRSRGSLANRSSAPQVSSNSAPWRNSYAEAMNNSINTRNSVAEVEMELQMDGVFKVPGCRMSVASKSRAGPPPTPRIPATSMENLSAWRNNQQADVTETPTLRRSGSRSSISSKKTPPQLPERRSSRLSNTSIASSQSMVVVDIQTEAKQKENLPRTLEIPRPPDTRSDSTKKPTAPVAPQPQQGALHQSFNPTKICKPPMSVQKRIPPPTPVRLTQLVPGSMTKPIAPVAPQISETSREREVETARLTRRASNSSINSRISVASVESSSSSGSGGSSSTFTGSFSSSSSSLLQESIAVIASKMNKSRKNRYPGNDSDSSCTSSSTITSDDFTDLRKITRKRPIPPPPKFKPTLPQAPIVTTSEVNIKKSGKKGVSSKAPAPPPPPPPPPILTYKGNNPKVTRSNADMSVQSGYKKQRNNPSLKNTSNLHPISLKKGKDILPHHQQHHTTTKSLGKKRQSEEDLNDLATAAKKLYSGTPITGVSPRHSPRFHKKPAVIESPKAVYV